MWEALCQKNRILKNLTNGWRTDASQLIVFPKSVNLNFFWAVCPDNARPLVRLSHAVRERCTQTVTASRLKLRWPSEKEPGRTLRESSQRQLSVTIGKLNIENLNKFEHWTNLNKLNKLNKFEHWTNWTNLNTEQIEQIWTVEHWKSLLPSLFRKYFFPSMGWKIHIGTKFEKSRCSNGWVGPAPLRLCYLFKSPMNKSFGPFFVAASSLKVWTR